MNWILLATPVVGVILLLIGMAMARRMMPLKHVDDAPEEPATPDYTSIVADIASTFAAYVVNVIRGERAFVVHGAAIKAMKDQGETVKNMTPQAAVEAEIEEAKAEQRILERTLFD